MSQVTDYTIPGSPYSMSQLATRLESLFAAAVSANRGASAPSNPFEGMLWWDSAANPEILKRYTVTGGWASLLSVNITTGAVLYSAYDADLATLSLPANTTISAFAKTLLGELTAAAARITLGVDPVGCYKPFDGAEAYVPDGWLLATGKTIGDATSGGTARANADTETYFTLIWNSYANTVRPIQDSGGTLTTRGATAADDFAAHKRIPILDMRGRLPLGADNMGGSSANRVTSAQADIVGGSDGAEEHLHTTGAVYLTGPQSGLQAHGHQLDSGEGSSGSAGALGGYLAGSQIIYTKNSANVTSPEAHGHGNVTTNNNMNPYLTANWIVKY